MKYAVGIDIGGTNTRVALIDENLNIVKRVQFPTNVENPAETIDEIARTIESFDEKPVGIGMSCPGPLDLKNGIILTPPNLGKPWWGLHLAKEVSKKTSLPATLENDANLACLAEAVVGEGKDKDWINFLTISTGVGSGQCVNKKIVQGAHGFAQEIANCILWKDGPAHGTLKAGGCEAICSGTAITKRAQDAGLDVHHAGEVNDLAKDGNDLAMVIMEDAKEYLANMIAILYAVNDPDIVILGGSVAMKIDGFVDDVEARVRKKVFDPLHDLVLVHKSTLSEDSGLLGAGILAFSDKADA